ncbi:MAG: outer membrane beta-barrel protein [Rhodopila sp.]
MRKHIVSGLTMCATLSVVRVPAYAVDGPKPVEFDGGPLGPLEFTAAADGYFYLQSGTSDNSHTSIAGSKEAGAEVNAWLIQVKKSTGLIQFTVQLAECQDINLGTNKPSEVNGNRYTTGPLRTAFVSIAPIPDFKLSVGQVSSLEGYESAFPWNNPVAYRTVLDDPQNSNSRGVEADYAHGPFSGSLVFGDGYDTGVWNYLPISGDSQNRFQQQHHRVRWRAFRHDRTEYICLW